MRTAICLLGAALLLACAEQTPSPQPGPWTLTRDAVGHYCSMTVADHPGPKGQILVGPDAEALWFSSVRDAVAFTRLPEEPRDIRAFYVNDMKDAEWQAPDYERWIRAESAWFVIGSRMRGGMGAPETVPFSDRAGADRFAASHGGRLVRLDDIPESYVLGAVETPPPVGPGPRP